MKKYYLNLLIVCLALAFTSYATADSGFWAKPKFLPFHLNVNLDYKTKKLNAEIVYDGKMNSDGAYTIEPYKISDYKKDTTLLVIKSGNREQRFKISKGEFYEIEGYPKNIIKKVVVEHKKVTVELLKLKNKKTVLKFRNTALFPKIRLRVRTTPTFSQGNKNHMGWLTQGEAVEYQQIRSTKKSTYKKMKDYWYFIRMPDGRRGWVFGSYVSFSYFPNRPV